MRSAPVFQVATRPAPSSMKIAKSWMPSTSRRNVSGVSRGVVAAGTTRFASMMTSMSGRTFRASLSRRRVDRRGAATLEASMEDEVVELREHVPLAPHTTFGLGGKARYFVECDSEDEVRAALAYAAERRLPAYVLGGGSNVVFLDSGFPGIILRITIGGMELRDGPSPEVRAGAGVDWDKLVQNVVQRGWTGVECLSGIPGTVGGTPIQNVGAYGQEIAETLVSVACLDRTTLERRTFTARDCAFGYRDSRFKRADRGRYVVLEVTLRLGRDQRPRIRYPELQRAVAELGGLDAVPPGEAVRLVREAVLALRRRKSMVLDPADPNTRSAGSFFPNPVLSPATSQSALSSALKSSGCTPGGGPPPWGKRRVPSRAGSPVTKTKRWARRGRCSRGCSYSARPPSRGICRSVTTASKRSLAGPSRSIASSPFSTATTSCPSRSSNRRMAWRFTASSSTTRMRSLGSVGMEGVARASGASTLFGSVTTTSAPPPVRGRSRSVPPDDCASARASANSISPPPALCVNRNGVTSRCSASTESGVPESHSEMLNDGPLSLTAIRNSRGGWLSRSRRRAKSSSFISISVSCAIGHATIGSSWEIGRAHV